MSDSPSDVDGDVLRRLKSHGMDFARRYRIDFNVDFSTWPPPADAITVLTEQYGNVAICEPQDNDPGDVVVQIEDIVTYELVIRMQARISELVAPFGGVCEAWGVLLDAKS